MIVEEDNATQIADHIRTIRQQDGGTSIHSCINEASKLITNALPASAIQVIDISTDGQSSLNSAITAGELVAEMVLEEGFTECNQDNNRQRIPVTSLLGDISLRLNNTVFGSNTDIDLATKITNTGSLEGSIQSNHSQRV